MKVERPVINQPPPVELAWRCHISSIVSVDLAESKKLIVTASTDHSVCLWTMTGRYIGEWRRVTVAPAGHIELTSYLNTVLWTLIWGQLF